MQIEYVAGVGLASGRTANEQRERAVRRGVLAEVIVDNQYVLALLHEILAHRAAGVGSDILQRSQLRSRGGDDNGIVHRAGICQRLDELRHGRTLLADGDVDADDVLAALIDDGIGRDGGLAGLAVADDQLTLATADGDHRVDGLDAGLQRNADAFAFDDAGSRGFDRAVLLGVDGAFAVNGHAQRVDDAADHGLAHRHGHHAAGTADGIALADTGVTAQHDDGNGVFLQILRHTVCAVVKFDQLAGHAVIQSCRAGDAVADQNDGAGLGLVDLCFIVLDLRTDDF